MKVPCLAVGLFHLFEDALASFEVSAPDNAQAELGGSPVQQPDPEFNLPRRRIFSRHGRGHLQRPAGGGQAAILDCRDECGELGRRFMTIRSNGYRLNVYLAQLSPIYSEIKPYDAIR